MNIYDKVKLTHPTGDTVFGWARNNGSVQTGFGLLSEEWIMANGYNAKVIEHAPEMPDEPGYYLVPWELLFPPILILTGPDAGTPSTWLYAGDNSIVEPDDLAEYADSLTRLYTLDDARSKLESLTERESPS